MKMVAASKLRRSQEKAESARPYSSRIEEYIFVGIFVFINPIWVNLGTHWGCTLAFANTNKISSEKEALKKEYKIIVSKNMKLSNLVKNLESIIKRQKDELKSQKDEIQNLKDKFAHH